MGVYSEFVSLVFYYRLWRGSWKSVPSVGYVMVLLLNSCQHFMVILLTPQLRHFEQLHFYDNDLQLGSIYGLTTWYQGKCRTNHMHR